MPSEFAALDTSFPNLEGKTTEQKLQSLTDYLYQLLEQLRYTLHNLGVENLNPASLDEIGKKISEPIYAEITDETEGLSTRITANSTAISTEVTRATGAEGTLGSRITQNADAITAEVTRATGAEGTLGSRITQTADAITAEVTRATGAEGTLSGRIDVNAGNILLKVSADGVISAINISPETVKIAASRLLLTGAITWDDLTAAAQSRVDSGKGDPNPSYIKTTYIDRTEIRSPTIRAGQFYGSEFHNSDPPEWESGTVYEVGDIVKFSGKYYRCTQQHTASVANQPSGTYSATANWSASLTYDTWLSMGESANAYSLEVRNGASETGRIFGVYNGDFGAVALSAKGYTFLMTDADGNAAGTAETRGDWTLNSVEIMKLKSGDSYGSTLPGGGTSAPNWSAAEKAANVGRIFFQI